MDDWHRALLLEDLIRSNVQRPRRIHRQCEWIAGSGRHIDFLLQLVTERASAGSAHEERLNVLAGVIDELDVFS